MEFAAFPVGQGDDSLLKLVVGCVSALVAAGSALAQDARIVASVLPQSRSVETGESATAFATMINASDVPAENCRIALGQPVPAILSYQTTDPATNSVTGAPDTPVDIAARGSQSFVISLETTRDFNPSEVFLRFDCENAAPAQIRDRVNLFRLTARTPGPPDIIALSATLESDGFVHLPDERRVGVFAVAASNVGSTGTIRVRAESGDANPPVSYEICQTDPATGACSTPRAETQLLTMASGANYTFGVFVRPNGYVPRNPGLYRTIIVFEETDGVERGSTSVAIQTDSGTPPAAATALLGFPSGRSFRINEADGSANVDIAIDAEDFALGSDGRAALYQNGQLIDRYESAQAVTLELPAGRHDIALRLVDLDDEFVFPDARSSGRVSVSTGGAPRLDYAGGANPVQPYQIVDLVGQNIFPSGNVYPGRFEGIQVDVMATAQGRMGFLVPDMDGFSGDGRLEVTIDGVDFALTVPVSTPSMITNPEQDLTDLVVDIRTGLETERDAAIARQEIAYADAMIAAINRINTIEGEIGALSPQEQSVALRLLRNFRGPQASALLTPSQMVESNSFASCSDALEEVPLRAKKGIVIGFVFVGMGSSILSTTGITPIGAFAGSFTFLAGVALIDGYRSEINATIDRCFEPVLQFEAQEQSFVSGGSISNALAGVESTGEVGFVSNQFQSTQIGVRRDPYPNMRQYLNEMLEALGGVSAYVPDAVLNPVLTDLRNMRDGLSFVYPDAAELDVTVDSGDVFLVDFVDAGGQGAYNLRFVASFSTLFNFEVSYRGQTVTVPAYIEVDPPSFGSFLEQLRIPPEGLEIDIPLDGNVESLDVVQNPLGGNFTYTVERIDGVHRLSVTPRAGFFGAEAVELVVNGRGGTREGLFVTMVTTGGFYYPHDVVTGLLATSSIRLGRRKQFNCFGLYTSNFVGQCLLRFPTDFNQRPRRNGIPMSVDISGLPNGMGRVTQNSEILTEVSLGPPRDQFGNPQDFDITVTIDLGQGALSHAMQVDTFFHEVDPNGPCDVCARSETFVLGLTAGSDIRLPLSFTGSTALDFLAQGPVNGTLRESGSVAVYEPDDGFTGLDQIRLQRTEVIPNVARVDYTETIELFVVPAMRRDPGLRFLTIPADQSCAQLYDGPAPVSLTYVSSFALRYGSYDASTGTLCIERSALNGGLIAELSMVAAFEYGSSTHQAEVRLEGGVIVEQ